jgi:hypothetical protein
VRQQRQALTFGLRTKDKDRMRSIGGRVLLMKTIRLRKKRVGTENTYRFLSIDKKTKSKGGRAIIHAPIIL